MYSLVTFMLRLQLSSSIHLLNIVLINHLVKAQSGVFKVFDLSDINFTTTSHRITVNQYNLEAETRKCFVIFVIWIL